MCTTIFLSAYFISLILLDCAGREISLERIILAFIILAIALFSDFYGVFLK